MSSGLDQDKRRILKDPVHPLERLARKARATFARVASTLASLRRVEVAESPLFLAGMAAKSPAKRGCAEITCSHRRSGCPSGMCHIHDVGVMELGDRAVPLQAEPARQWKNLKGIPIAWMTSEFGAGGSPVANVEFLKQVGCAVEMLRLRDYGIYGNGNLMPMEKNNHEVFGVLRGWLERNRL